MMKKLGSFIFCWMLFVFVSAFSGFIGMRMFLQPENLAEFSYYVLDEEEFWEEIGIDIVFKETIDKKELSKEIGIFTSESIKYSLGVEGIDKPNINKIRILLEKYILEYEEKYNIEIDREEINTYLDEIEKEFSVRVVGAAGEDVEMLFDIFVSEKILIILVGLILLFICLDLLIRKNLIVVSLHTGIVAIINAVDVFCISFIFYKMIVSNVESASLFKILINISNKIGSFSLIVGIILITVYLLFRKKIKEEANINNNNDNYLDYNIYNN